jgi:hypothetical protein
MKIEKWTYIEKGIPDEYQECEITSPEFRATRMAVFIRNTPMPHWRLTRCRDPHCNIFISLTGTAWRIIEQDEPSDISQKIISLSLLGWCSNKSIEFANELDASLNHEELSIFYEKIKSLSVQDRQAEVVKHLKI